MPTPVEGTITTPSGAVVRIQDIVDHETYATFELPAVAMRQPPPTPSWDLDPFTVARSMKLHSGRFATLADTNLPRSGAGGLPQDWWGLVFGWRAALVGAPADLEDRHVQRWIDQVAARLHFNQKIFAELPLTEILKAPKQVGSEPIGDLDPANPVPEMKPTQEQISDLARVMKGTIGDITIPLWIRHNISYGVRLDMPPAPSLREPLAIRFFLRGWWRRVVV